jgi:hypothetical protein
MSVDLEFCDDVDALPALYGSSERAIPVCTASSRTCRSRCGPPFVLTLTTLLSPRGEPLTIQLMGQPSVCLRIPFNCGSPSTQRSDARTRLILLG